MPETVLPTEALKNIAMQCIDVLPGVTHQEVFSGELPDATLLI